LSIIAFMGDLYLNKKIEIKYSMPEYYIFNLEYSITKDKTTPCPDKVNLGSDFSDYTDMFGKNPTAVTLANNHVLDYGKKGFENTLSTLKEKGIKYAGAGCDDDNYNNPQLIDLNDSKISVLSYSQFDMKTEGYGVALAEKERIERDIQAAKKNGATSVIVCIHWGTEDHPCQNRYQEEMGKFIIDSGADLVVGNHTHCVQPFVKYKDKYIFYSVGNFFFENINVECFYDENGNSRRKWRKRNLKCNKTAYVVLYDTAENKVCGVDELTNNGKTVIYKRSKDVNKNYCVNKSLGKLIYMMRKYGGFLISNMFVDKKLFDFAAVKHELNMKSSNKN